MKKFLCVMLAAVMCLSFTACGSSDNKTEESGDGLKEINVVLDWYPNGIHTFIYDAIEKGYYEEEGLKVNIQFPSNSNDALSLVAANRAEIGMYYMNDIITTRTNQDVPVKAIAAVVQQPMNIFLSLEDKGVKSPADLEGKMIGYAGAELNKAIVKYAIEQNGGVYDESKLVDVGFELMSAMTTGQVDATIGCMKYHEVPQMESEGFKLNYFSTADAGVPSLYEFVFIANDKMIDEDPETLEAFLRASKKGYEDMKADPDAALKVLLDNQNAENFPLDENVERQSIATCLPAMESADSPVFSMKPEVWEESINWLYDLGLIEERIDVSEVMTTELLPE